MTLALKKHLDISEKDISELVDDIRALRSDVAKVLRKARPGLIDSGLETAREAAEDLSDYVSDRAQSLYRDAAKQGVQTYARTSKALGRQLREQPVASILIAVGAGLLLSKMLSRD